MKMLGLLKIYTIQKMDFNQIVKKKLMPILDKYDIHIVEDRRNYLKFQFVNVTIILSYNELEYSSILYLGKNDDEVNEIDDFILASFFKLDLKLNVASIELFANNVLLFINNEAKKIFVSDTKVLDELNKFCIMRNKDYTMKLLKIQNLAKLDKAWVSRDDVIFIKTVNSMNLNELPKSYKLKYKIVFNRSMNNP